MKRVALVFLLFTLLLPAAAATQITEEAVTIEIGDPATVTVLRHYDSITTDRISYLVSGRYAPGDLSARDDAGGLDCQVDDLAVGSEILCTPRNRTNYTVAITYTGDFSARNENIQVFGYTNRIFVPTDRIRTRVVLPEGFGLVRDSGPPYQPGDAEVGSEGRRIFLQWTENDTGLGEAFEYQVRYEELAVLERITLRRLTIFLAIAVIILSGIVFYVWRERGQDKTIASVFPVLKEDEQEVIRYIIDHEGEVEQREVVNAMDYSKAKISRLISDLEERNLIEKQKRGRINVVTLARETGDLNGG